MQSRGKQKAEVLSKPYWCWSLICMCYQPISLDTPRLTHEHSCAHTPKHMQGRTLMNHPCTFTPHREPCIHTFTHFLTEYRCLLTFSLSIYSLCLSHPHTCTPFPLSLLPYAPDCLQICRYYRKSLPICLLGEKRGENY